MIGEVFEDIAGYFVGIYDSIASVFGGSTIALLVLKMVFFILLLTAVALFIWKFYNSLSEKDILPLNLSKYGKGADAGIGKIFAIGLYLLEYIIIAPIFIALWAAALSAILLLITKQRSIDEILMISVAMIGAVRILAYYKKEVAIDLSKLFPFVVLTVFLLEPGALSVQSTILKFGEIPLLLNSFAFFLLVVFVIELFLRLLYTIFEFWSSEDDSGEEKRIKR